MRKVYNAQNFSLQNQNPNPCVFTSNPTRIRIWEFRSDFSDSDIRPITSVEYRSVISIGRNSWCQLKFWRQPINNKKMNNNEYSSLLLVSFLKVYPHQDITAIIHRCHNNILENTGVDRGGANGRKPPPLGPKMCKKSAF